MSLRDLRRHAGRLAVVGFSGTSAPDDLRRLAAEFDLGGVIYFARNIQEPRQVAELSKEIAGLARAWPFWISVDQEGGRVARLKRPFTEWPPMRSLGRSGDPALVARFGTALAAELSAVGINLDFAPVLDVWTNPANTVIGDRAFGDRAEIVAALGRVLVRALQQHGVMACGKHFPGHGDTVSDSHERLPTIEHERRRLEAVELVPFQAAIEEGVAGMMVAHVVVPAHDESRPASLSKTIVTDLLKGTMAFSGVVFCDDLGMQAVSATRTLAETTVETIAAGCDVALLCNSTADEQLVAIEALIKAAESGVLSAARIEDAFARQQAAKIRMAAGAASPVPLHVVGSESHHAVAREMAAWS